MKTRPCRPEAAPAPVRGTHRCLRTGMNFVREEQRGRLYLQQAQAAPLDLFND